MYSDGSEIRTIDYNEQLQSMIVTGESRIQSLDYDPVDKIIYWIDSFDSSIKRAIIPDIQDPNHGMAFTQDMNLKSTNKLIDIDVDWVARYVLLFLFNYIVNLIPFIFQEIFIGLRWIYRDQNLVVVY